MNYLMRVLKLLTKLQIVDACVLIVKLAHVSSWCTIEIGRQMGENEHATGCR